MDRVQRGTPDSGRQMSTPEEHEWSRSAPGTEAFKQDYAAWQSLAADVTKALERAEGPSPASCRARSRTIGCAREAASASLTRIATRVSKYFESIAIKKK